jgi:tetratricopeptide (TPR) repeat protein
MTVSPGPQSETDRGWQLLAAGRVTEALALAEQIAARTTDSDTAFHLMAEAALQSGNAAKAVHAAGALVKRRDDLHWTWGLLARSILASGCPGEAVDPAMRSVALPGATAATLGNAATILSAAGRHDVAMDLFMRAAALAPDDPRHLFNLAMQRRYVGDLDGAEADCDRVIALDPDHFEAWLMRSSLRRQTSDNNHVGAIQTRLAHGVGSWRGEGQLLYAMAKELEDLGDHARSFAVLARGAQLRRFHMNYDVARDIRMMEALIAAFPSGGTEKGANSTESADAIFIVGLPRTGTTLAERIISSHSQVESLGEPSAFPAAMMAGMRNHKRGNDPKDRIDAALAIDPPELGRSYLQRLAGQRGAAAKFIDKLPMNFLNIGLIRRALPGARIIHLRRDPMDAGYAMFKTWFADAYPFSYDQKELGLYIAAYHRLMAHWKSIFPEAIVEIEYEELVEDIEGQARRMLAHCGLDWEDACAQPHRNAAPSTTASASQVREPVHRRSVGNWRNYRRELEPMRAILAAAGLIDGDLADLP